MARAATAARCGPTASATRRAEMVRVLDALLRRSSRDHWPVHHNVTALDAVAVFGERPRARAMQAHDDVASCAFDDRCAVVGAVRLEAAPHLFLQPRRERSIRRVA